MIRHEYGLWSLFRTDKNIRYIAKSLMHRKDPQTAEDQKHFENVHEELRSYSTTHEKPAALRLSAVGDLMWIRSGWPDFISDGLKSHLDSRDIRLANLETPIHAGKPVRKYLPETFYYNAPKDYLGPWMETTAQTVFSICNNHALDQNQNGIQRTRAQILSHPGFHCVGGADRAHSIATLKHSTLRISVLGLTYGINHSNRGIPDGIPVHLFGRPGLEPDWHLIEKIIQDAKKSDPDLLILMPHWGFEYEYYPDEAQRKHAYRLIELGVDVILGTSPHVVQPVEIISIDQGDSTLQTQLHRGESPRCGAIAYSLGNFSTVMPTLACKAGMILDLDLELNCAGKLSVTGLHAVPTLSLRGLEKQWLDVKTYSTDEITRLGKPEIAQSAEQHLQLIVGPIVHTLQRNPNAKNN